MLNTKIANEQRTKELIEEFEDYLVKEQVVIPYDEWDQFQYDPYGFDISDWIESEYSNNEGPKINEESLINLNNEHIDNNSHYAEFEYLDAAMESIISDFLDEKDYEDESLREFDEYVLNNAEDYGLNYLEYVTMDYNLDLFHQNYEILTDILIDNENLNTEGYNLEATMSCIRQMRINEDNNSLLKSKEGKSDAEFVLDRINDYGLSALGFAGFRYDDIFTYDLINLLARTLEILNKRISALEPIENSSILLRVAEDNDLEQYQVSDSFEKTLEYLEKCKASIDEVFDDLSQIKELENKIDDEKRIDKNNINDYVDEVTIKLFESQGYKVSDLCDDEKVKNSEFLSSFLEEMINLFDIGVYTAATILSIEELKDAIKNKEINIERGTVFGMFDPVCGSGSLMNIFLEKDFKLPLRYVRFSNQNASSYGYSTTEVYGSLL